MIWKDCAFKKAAVVVVAVNELVYGLGGYEEQLMGGNATLYRRPKGL